MKFYVYAKSYDSWGGNPHLSLIGDFLLQRAPHFGDAINEINVTLVLPDRGPPKKTLGSLFETHHRYRSTLPKVTFHRMKRRVEIAIASESMDGRDWKFTPCTDLAIFSCGVEEVVAGLGLLQKRLKASDDFNLEALLAHCAVSKTLVPSNENDLQVIIADLRAAVVKRRVVMSPWDKLGIDWEDFHPRAKTILDDPFFWDCTDDFSPNGNDTGADLLEGYRDWLKKHKDGHPAKFIEVLAKRWGYNGHTDMDEEVRDEADVALAYADVKLRGFCDAQARQSGLDAIKNQRRIANEAIDWPHRQERLQALDRLEAKLVAVVTH
jgi:uncharacterized protein YfeS